MNLSAPGNWVQRFTLGLLLTGAMAGSAVLVFAIGALGPTLIRELSLSPVRFGALTTAFYVSATVFAPPSGRLVDGFGGRRPLMAVFVVSGCGLMLAATLHGYGWLIVAMIAGGAAAGASNPATNALVAQYFPLGSQGLVIGAKQSGIYLGAAIAGLGLPPMAVRVGWRASMLAFGAIVLGGAVATRFVLTAAVGLDIGPRAPQPARGRPKGQPLILAGYAATLGAGATAITVYVAVFAHSVLGYTETHAAALVGLLGVIGIAGRIVSAWACERLVQASQLLLAFAVLAVCSTILIALSEGIAHWLVWLGIVGIALSGASFMSVLMLTLIRDSGLGTIGRTTGTVQSGFYSGLLASPLLFGFVLELTGSYLIGWVLCGGFFASGLVLSLVWRRGLLMMTPHGSPHGSSADDT